MIALDRSQLIIVDPMPPPPLPPPPADAKSWLSNTVLPDPVGPNTSTVRPSMAVLVLVLVAVLVAVAVLAAASCMAMVRQPATPACTNFTGEDNDAGELLGAPAAVCDGVDVFSAVAIPPSLPALPASVWRLMMVAPG